MLDAMRMAVAADDHDRLDLRHYALDAIEPVMQARLRGADLVVRHAVHHLVDFGEGAVDGLEHAQRLLLHDVDRALDALVSGGLDVVVGNPGRVSEHRRRQHQRRNHHQLEEANRRFPCCVH